MKAAKKAAKMLVEESATGGKLEGSSKIESSAAGFKHRRPPSTKAKSSASNFSALSEGTAAPHSEVEGDLTRRRKNAIVDPSYIYPKSGKKKIAGAALSN